MKKMMIVCVGWLITTQAIAQNDMPNRTQNAKTSDTIIVPMGVRTAFDTKYPRASKVRWYRYTPATSGTMEPGVWYSTMDGNDYYVSFLWNDDDYIAWYDNGNWIHSTQQIDHAALPTNINQILSRDYPGFIVTDVDMEYDQKQTLYEVKMEKGNERWNIHITPEGMVTKKKPGKLNSVTANNTIVTDFTTRYPNASNVTWYSYDPWDNSIVDVLPSDWNYSMDASDYQVMFMADGNEYVAYYDNGTWVRAETRTFTNSQLPAAINTIIMNEYAGYSINDVDMETNRSQMVYEVELSKGSDKCKIHYAADGSVVKKKCWIAGVKTKS